jgi:phosphatidylserine/phosphatidylglycerophosphate/cardiolipin synthase-like enzyme
MANGGVQGKVVDEKGKGIEGLDIVVVDFDPFFSEDKLGTTKTLNDGSFKVTYPTGKFDDWIPGRNPDLAVRVYGPGCRLLHETAERSNVSDPILTITNIEIHRANIEGWLVTNATLRPNNPLLNADGTPVTWTKGNKIEVLRDGDAVFPAITDAVKQAKKSINLMNMNFWISEQLITKFDPTFMPENPQQNVAVPGEKLHEALKAQSQNIPVNVIVQNVPFIDQIPVISYLLRVIPFIGLNPDTLDEVKQFFQGSKVKIRSLDSFQVIRRLVSFMHSKLLVIDGNTAFVMGSTISQGYYNDPRHLIHDARHRGDLTHDMSIKVVGPAVEFVDRSFTALWNSADAADSSSSSLSPATNQPQEKDGIGVQVIRTLPGGVIDAAATGGDAIAHGETGALEGYQRAIAKAKKYIYIEDQYLTAPEIFTAILSRMKQTTEAPNLEVILVINAEPDVSGYPELQIQLLQQLQKDLTKALGQAAVDKRLGVYTIWSCNEQSKTYEVMPIYIHSKSAIIDDVWATIGSTNLDGASLNHIQLDTIVEGKLTDMVDTGNWFKRLMVGVIYALVSPLIIAIDVATKIGFARETQHANPQQSRQPSRSSELNLTICEKDPDPSKPNSAVVKLRDALWAEHLGLQAPLSKPTKGWVEIWNMQADQKKMNLQQEPAKPANQRQKNPAKVLKWVPKVKSKDFLQAANINIDQKLIKIRKDADKFDFIKGKWE